MFCAFFTLLMMVGGLSVLAWLGWRRVQAHLKTHPEAARALADHLLTPLLLGEEAEARPPPQPEAPAATLDGRPPPGTLQRRSEGL
jgi:hypothetical protein